MPKDYTKDFFDAILEIKGEMGEIKGDVRGIHTQMKLQNGRLNVHSKRINDNESSIDQNKGKAMGAGFIAGAIGGIITIVLAILTFFRK